MAGTDLTYPERLRLYEKACLAWASADDPTILSWQFEREGREGEFDVVERNKLVEFLKKLGLTDDLKTKDYWVKAREMIRSELTRSEETELQVAQPDKITLEGLEKIAQDQARRRNIPLSAARKLVWQVLRAQAKTVVEEASVVSAKVPVNIPQEETAPVEKNLTVESQQRLDREMKRLTESADRRNYNLRREPDKILFEAIKGIFAQILRKSDTPSQITPLVVAEEEQKIEFDQPLDSAENTREIYRSGQSRAAREIAQQVLSKLTKKGLQAAGERLGWTVTSAQIAVKTAGGAAAKAGVGLLGKVAAGVFGGPVGWVIAIGSLLKGAFDFAVKGGLGKFLKKLFPGLLSQGQIYAKQGLDATVGGGSSGIGMSAGAIIGAIMGAAGGPAGMLGLALIGAVLGRTAGSFLGGFFGGSITLEPGRGVDITGEKQKKKKSLLALLGSASIMAAGAWAVLILVILIILFFLNQNKQQDQVTIIPFTVSITADPTKISGADFEVNNRQAQIRYTINITAKSGEVGLKKVKISVKQTNSQGQSFLLLSPKDLALSKNSLSPGESTYVLFDFDIPGQYDPATFDNSKIYGLAEVTGQAKDEPEETKTASALTVIGNPPFNQPYGYPAEGTITSLDIEPANRCVVTMDSGQVVESAPLKKADGTSYCPTGPGIKKSVLQGHCGTLLNLFGFGRKCLTGGMDLAKGGGNVPVYSTIDGTVIKSVWDLGDNKIYSPTSTCVPNDLNTVLTNGQPRFCYPALGGAVYIQSDDGKYVVAFLHLAKDGLIPERTNLLPTKVIQGQQIGKTYPDKICEYTKDQPVRCTTTGSHVHYQIFLDLTNVDFNDVNVVGSCLDGKILPKTSDDQPLPVLGQYVSQSMTECK